MEKPSEAQIKQLKEKYADRALHLVSAKDDGDPETYYVVLKGANEDEYRIFTDDVFAAREKSKNDADKNERMRIAGTNAIVRQCVWPERDELKKLLFDHPGFVGLFAEKIHDQVGSSAEVRSEKL